MANPLDNFLFSPYYFIRYSYVNSNLYDPKIYKERNEPNLE